MVVVAEFRKPLRKATTLAPPSADSVKPVLLLSTHTARQSRLIMSSWRTREKTILKSMKRSVACLMWSSSPISYSSIIFCVSYAMYSVKSVRPP